MIVKPQSYPVICVWILFKLIIFTIFSSKIFYLKFILKYFLCWKLKSGRCVLHRGHMKTSWPLNISSPLSCSLNIFLKIIYKSYSVSFFFVAQLLCNDIISVFWSNRGKWETPTSLNEMQKFNLVCKLLSCSLLSKVLLAYYC